VPAERLWGAQTQRSPQNTLTYKAQEFDAWVKPQDMVGR
jgi:fumarate hydratase class II